MAVLGLRFCARAFSSCGKWGPLFIAVCGPLTAAASLLRSTGSVIVAHGPSRSATCGILPDQVSNPCPMHWQADSQPLRHQGSPTVYFKLIKTYVHSHTKTLLCNPPLLYILSQSISIYIVYILVYSW